MSERAGAAWGSPLTWQTPFTIKFRRAPSLFQHHFDRGTILVTTPEGPNAFDAPVTATDLGGGLAMLTFPKPDRSHRVMVHLILDPTQGLALAVHQMTRTAGSRAVRTLIDRGVLDAAPPSRSLVSFPRTRGLRGRIALQVGAQDLELALAEDGSVTGDLGGRLLSPTLELAVLIASREGDALTGVVDTRTHSAVLSLLTAADAPFDPAHHRATVTAWPARSLSEGLREG